MKFSCNIYNLNFLYINLKINILFTDINAQEKEQLW